MPAYPRIDRYYAEKQRLIDYGSSDNEQSIRLALVLSIPTTLGLT